MVEHRRRELELLRQKYGEVDADPDVTWIRILSFPLPAGWSKQLCQLIVTVPPGYPITPPDNFYLEQGVTLASGAQPGNSSPGQQLNGSTWTIFSYHVEAGTWRPNADIGRGHNLITYVEGIEARLREAT